MRNPFTSLPGAALLTGLVAVGLAAAFAGSHDGGRAARLSEAAMLPGAAFTGDPGDAVADAGAADTTGSPGAPPKSEVELAAAARALAERFANTLGLELHQALASGGPVAALAVCRERAPAIAAALAHETGWRVGRTSLRVRSTADLPDVWETRGLQEFTARHAEGSHVYRYLKAIPIEEPCLACHGKALDPEAAARIAQLYPHDQSTGFSLGDVAGAFTIIIPTGE
jgi:hypothetical protein